MHRILFVVFLLLTLIAPAAAATDTPLPSGPTGTTAPPALVLAGSLEGTPTVATTCRPFTIRYQVRNAGAVAPTYGALKVEIRSADQKQLISSQQIPFSLEAGAKTIDRLDAPPGAYTVTLHASAMERQRGLTAESVLAKQPLTVTGTVEVKRSSASMPRVLVWSSADDSTIGERAIIDKLLKESFDADSMYLRIVTSAGDFTSYALTGLYNVYLILEVDGAPDAAEALRHVLAKGHGVILAGSGDRMQALAEALDFRYGSPYRGNRAIITFPEDSVLGLTGTIPVSGRILSPRKQDARTAATLPDGQPAILSDVQDKGRVILMPFSLVKSALNAGSTDLYSLLLRSSVLTVTPEPEAPGSSTAIQLLISSSSGGQEKARIIENLPPGAKVLWTSVPPSTKDGTLTFELTAEGDAKKIIYLFQPAEPGKTKTSSDLFTECGGKFVSQGKVE